MAKDIILSIQQMYDESSDYWNDTRSRKYKKTGTANWPVTQKYLDQLRRGQGLLDVGCGNGRLVSGLPVGVKYLGIDFSEKLLDEARKSFPKKEFRYGNIIDKKCWENLDKYDAVFCVAVLHHVPERQQQLYVLKQIKKIMKKNAFLFLSVWNLWQERFLQAHLDSLELKKQNTRWLEVPFAKKWKRFCVQMDIPYLTELVQEAGLDTEEVFYADRDGRKSDILHGQNLILIAK